MVRLTALSNGQNQPVIRLGKKGQPCKQLNPETVVAIRAQSLTPRAGTIAYLPCKQPIINGCAIRVRLLTPRAGTIVYYAQQAALSTKTTRSPTPRAVRSTTSPNKQASTNIQLGRLHQERYDRQLHPTSGTINKENSVAYPKSGTIDYFTPRAVQSLQQLGRLPQERYDRLLHPKSSTSTPTTRSPTLRAVRSTTSQKERQKHSNNLVAKSSIIKHSTQRTSAINSTTQSSDYFTPRAEQSAKTTRPFTPRAVWSTTSP